MNEEYVRVIVENLPTTVKAFVFHDFDGNPIIVLNDRLSYFEKVKAYRHEMNHINNGDMDNPLYREYGNGEEYAAS